MNNKSNFVEVPMWLKIVSAIGVLWFLFGFSQFAKNVFMDVAHSVASGAISEAHGEAIIATPAIIWIAYLFACLFGLIGAVQLFRGHKSANFLFASSLILDVIYFGWIRFFSGTAGDRAAEAGIIALIVIGVTTFYTMLSYWRKR